MRFSIISAMLAMTCFAVGCGGSTSGIVSTEEEYAKYAIPADVMAEREASMKSMAAEQAAASRAAAAEGAAAGN